MTHQAPLVNSTAPYLAHNFARGLATSGVVTVPVVLTDGRVWVQYKPNEAMDSTRHTIFYNDVLNTPHTIMEVVWF